jgi:preprotein translocase subunit SecA
LRDMDDLRQSVGTAQYEQKDPLLIYKFEAFKLFQSMVDVLNREVASFLFKGQLPNQESSEVQQAKAPQKGAYDNMQASHASSDGGRGSSAQTATAPAPKRQPVQVEKKIGRNENVTVQHLSSGEKKEMKFKKAESLVASGQWIVVNN